MSDKTWSDRTDYERLEYAKPNEKTLAQFDKIYEWMIENERVPSIKEVMAITGLTYWPAGTLRRRAMRSFPKLDMEEISFSVKELLLERIRSKELDNNNLVKLMPWVSPPMTTPVDVKQEITHRFVVVKPDAQKETDDN